jgi:predicted glycosyltransferase
MQNNAPQKKVYFPVESLVGLGHFNRAGKIVRDMVQTGFDVTVASSTFVDPNRFFSGAQQTVISPYVFKDGGEAFYSVNSAGKKQFKDEFNEKSWAQNRTQEHLQNVDRIKPDVFISEFWPFDRPSLDIEMTAILSKLETQPKNNLRLASVRDVLDRYGDGTFEEERANRAINIINDNFHAVLVHGDSKFVPLNETFKAADRIRIPLIYTGYVLDDLPQRIVPEPDKGPLIVSCGSGTDGEEMVFSFLTSLEKILPFRDSDSHAAFVTKRPIHIVCGPRFYEGAFKAVQHWGEKLRERYGCDIVVSDYRQDFTSLLAKAAFSISLAGYNTTLETLALNVPALFIPKYATVRGSIRISTEQQYRLERLQSQNMARFAHPQDVQSSSRFADILVREMTTQLGQARRPAELDFSGAVNTSAAITRLLDETKKHSTSFVTLKVAV